MMRSLLFLLAVLLSLSLSEAFSILPSSLSLPRAESSTAVHFFGAGRKQANDKKEAKKGKNVASKNEKKKEPFVFLYGKPQYDWVQNRQLTLEETKSRHKNWLNKADKTKGKK